MHQDYIKISWSNWSIFNLTRLLVKPASRWSFHVCVHVHFLCMCLFKWTWERRQGLKRNMAQVRLSRSPCLPVEFNSNRLIGIMFNKALQCSLKTVITAIMIRKENAYIYGNTKLNTSISAVSLSLKLHPNKVRSVVKMRESTCKKNDNKRLSLSFFFSLSLLLCVLLQRNLLTKRWLLFSRCWGVRVPSIGQLFTNRPQSKRKKERKRKEKNSFWKTISVPSNTNTPKEHTYTIT